MAETETSRQYVSRPRRRDQDHNPGTFSFFNDQCHPTLVEGLILLLLFNKQVSRKKGINKSVDDHSQTILTDKICN